MEPRVEPKPPKVTKRGRNGLRFISILLILGGVVLLIIPFYPAIRYYLFPSQLSSQGEEIIRLAQIPLPPSPTFTPTGTLSPTGTGTPSPTATASSTLTPSPQQPILPAGPMIVIPKIGLEARITLTLSWEDLMAGVGHDPDTVAPGENGVCLLYGHRFLNWTDPSTGYFYLLDKLQPGDPVILFWEGKAFRYIAKETKIIEPTDFSIYDDRSAPTAVLVTCTPLWTDQYRLVVFAELEQTQPTP
jgi:LPXTG-site transpeptidase (sortase) family protein